jgi:hypothetical protein
VNIGQDGGQIVKEFRAVAQSYTRLFEARKNHIRELLGSSYNYYSGIFREGLLRDFLVEALPTTVSVSSGFIYGFGQVENSKQLDIIIWDSGRHAAVYRTPEFAIVTPESVVAVISVKSKAEDKDIRDGLSNLLSVTPLDMAFRGARTDDTGKPLFPPIVKILIGFEALPPNCLDVVGRFYRKEIAVRPDIASRLQNALSQINPMGLDPVHRYPVERVYAKLVTTLEGKASVLQGWGPPDESPFPLPPGLKRAPFGYLQEAQLTTPFEKMMYYVVAAVDRTLGAKGWSLRAAWADLNPITGSRIGDVAEVVESSGVPLFDGTPAVPQSATP